MFFMGAVPDDIGMYATLDHSRLRDFGFGESQSLLLPTGNQRDPCSMLSVMHLSHFKPCSNGHVTAIKRQNSRMLSTILAL